MNRLAKILLTGKLPNDFNGMQRTLTISDCSLRKITKDVVGADAIEINALRDILTPPQGKHNITNFVVPQRLDAQGRKNMSAGQRATRQFYPLLQYLRVSARSIDDPLIINGVNCITTSDIGRHVLRHSVNSLASTTLEDNAYIVRHMVNKLSVHIHNLLRINDMTATICYSFTARTTREVNSYNAPFDMATRYPYTLTLLPADTRLSQRERAQSTFHELIEILVDMCFGKLFCNPDNIIQFQDQATFAFSLVPRYVAWLYLNKTKHRHASVVVLETILGMKFGNDCFIPLRNKFIDVIPLLRKKQYYKYNAPVLSASALYKAIMITEKQAVDIINCKLVDSAPMHRRLLNYVHDQIIAGFSLTSPLPASCLVNKVEIPFPEIYDAVNAYRCTKPLT